MSERTHAWPTLDHDELAPMVGYVNRVVQVAGNYTLDAPFEVGWGNTVLDVTPRGLRTPTFRQPGVAFTVHASAPQAGMYAYIWPAPDGLEGRS
ncbi:DUF5996 family protein [Streptomyces cyaneofuscatus]|uniref:DUF5996 family protein n=1 Tax=Streptomyces cyaneofuscatus TaxID=66883 RepID=UPI00380B5425